MIRFFINLIQYALALILLVLGIVFFGPIAVEYVDQIMAETEDAESASEQFQAIARVRELLNEKEISEVSLKDILRVIDSEDSGELNSGDGMGARQIQLEKVGLSLSDIQKLSVSDIQALRCVYEQILGGEDESMASPPSAMDEAVRRSDDLTSADGL